MQSRTQEINPIQAEFCTALTDPNQVKNIYKLSKDSKNVKDFADSIDLPPASTFCHLKVVRCMDLEGSKRDGQNVIYSLSASELVHSLDLLLEILYNPLVHRNNLIKTVRSYERK